MVEEGLSLWVYEEMLTTIVSRTWMVNGYQIKEETAKDAAGPEAAKEIATGV